MLPTGSSLVLQKLQQIIIASKLCPHPTSGTGGLKRLTENDRRQPTTGSNSSQRDFPHRCQQFHHDTQRQGQIQNPKSHQSWFVETAIDASDIGGVKFFLSWCCYTFPPLAVVFVFVVNILVVVGGSVVVNLNHSYDRFSGSHYRGIIMRFSDNSSHLPIAADSAGAGGSSGASGHHPVGVESGVSVVVGLPGASTVATAGGGPGFGVVGDDVDVVRPAGSMNITPALSQVLLAPTSASGSGAVISAVASAISSATKVVGTTGSDNVTSEEINNFYFYETEQFAVLWALFTVIVLGNSAVLVTLLLNKNRKSRMNFFIKHLAIADLCVGLLNVLTDIIQRMTVAWKAGNAACKAIRFTQVGVTYASTYVLVALSIDRYDAITHPMNFSGCWNRARRLVAAAWSFSALFSVPIVYFYEEQIIQGRKQCWIELGEPWRWQIYMCWVASSLFVLPALIISACYAIIVKTIWAKGAIMGPIDRTRNGMADLASRRASSRGIIPKAKVKTVKMTIVIVIVFVLCWSPYIVFDLLQVFQQIPKTQTNIAIATFIQSLAPLNSAANPLIYCLFSTQVCRMIKRLPPFRWLLASKWCCKTASDVGSGRGSGLRNGAILNGHGGPRLQNHNSSDSMRTLTTSLTNSTSQRSCIRPSRVVIVERPKVVATGPLAMSEV
ncbi:cardioacceleratory peptide receptor-like [Uranotaenia lowii]|uniref:cardioacceleratory peptide receptor-like n=1 Tax=Uranotaenia lowii TaxID=190385 RepID=UPI002479CE44|nr:cardioacceleratory peptide receptor-like [Uranotaenia lowii]XP_055602619.1 cardioacceleratory peptide receptor-like [Uranotaenia lowii]XP_055602620.1 cardioacceleratory peptide receptor-like [Uranotaenia lowii]XP_055602621.1 cardioacceleratory peptide receptor-like [Uranotaenia lowii]